MDLLAIEREAQVNLGFPQSLALSLLSEISDTFTRKKKEERRREKNTIRVRSLAIMRYYIQERSIESINIPVMLYTATRGCVPAGSGISSSYSILQRISLS